MMSNDSLGSARAHERPSRRHQHRAALVHGCVTAAGGGAAGVMEVWRDFTVEECMV